MNLIVTRPQDNYLSDTSTIEVGGSTSPGAVVSVNDDIVIADSQGNFDVTVNLDEGPNSIDVVASNDAGDETGVTLVVIYATGG